MPHWCMCYLHPSVWSAPIGHNYNTTRQNSTATVLLLPSATDTMYISYYIAVISTVFMVYNCICSLCPSRSAKNEIFSIQIFGCPNIPKHSDHCFIQPHIGSKIYVKLVFINNFTWQKSLSIEIYMYLVPKTILIVNICNLWISEWIWITSKYPNKSNVCRSPTCPRVLKLEQKSIQNCSWYLVN